MHTNLTDSLYHTVLYLRIDTTCNYTLKTCLDSGYIILLEEIRTET